MAVRNTIKFVISLVPAMGICLLAGNVGSMYTALSIPTWYAGLHKPDLISPSREFAPVWTAL
ncbi:MAG: tryptophan-rich sensory protein [Methanoregula sp.]|nr:tryptophan-rich sensory protein [Methanoregula sp.]